MADESLTLKGSTFKIKDGSTHEITLTLLEGAVEITAGVPENIRVMDRGVMHHDLEGQERPGKAQFTIHYQYLEGDGSDISPLEALTKTGNASAWSSTTSAGRYHCDLELTLAKRVTASHREVLTLTDAFLSGQPKVTLNANDTAKLSFDVEFTGNKGRPVVTHV